MNKNSVSKELVTSHTSNLTEVVVLDQVEEAEECPAFAANPKRVSINQDETMTLIGVIAAGYSPDPTSLGSDRTGSLRIRRLKF